MRDFLPERPRERPLERPLAGTLAEALQLRLREDIILGVLPPASKLKLEALSRRYEVSINTMRETLSRLSADGLVVAEGQKGFAVPPATAQDLREITEMRQLLECRALRDSIAHGDLDWEARIVGAYHKLARAEALVEAYPEAHGEAWERGNREFHEALISNCPSRWLRVYRATMYDHSRRYRMLSLKTQAFPRQQSAREHERILRAALARDAQTAERELAGHILKAAEFTGFVQL